MLFRSNEKSFDKPISEYDKSLECSQIVENKINGTRREEEVGAELNDKYPESEGYNVIREAYLRDKDGNIVKDPETDSARRIDFIVVKDEKVVESVEVTSLDAPKEKQSAKEARIRENGGNFIKLPDGSLAEFPEGVTTNIERRD